MSRPTNEPNPLLSEIDDLKPLSFDDAAEVPDPQKVDATLGSKTEAEDVDSHAAMRQPAGFGEMEVWPVLSEENATHEKSFGAQEFEDVDDFDDLP